MKKLIAIGLFVFTICVSVFAQKKKEAKSPEDKAAHRTERLTKELALTPDQASKVKALLIQQDEQVQALKTKHANNADKAVLKQELQTTHEQNEAALKQVLTAEQITKYEELKAQKKAQKANKHHKKGNHKKGK